MHSFQQIIRKKKSIDIQYLWYNQESEVRCWTVKGMKEKESRFHSAGHTVLKLLWYYLNPESIRPKVFLWVNKTFPLSLSLSIHDMLNWGGIKEIQGIHVISTNRFKRETAEFNFEWNITRVCSTTRIVRLRHQH